MIDTAQIRSDAFGRWPGILQALGVDPKFLRDVHGPCPVCGGTDRFRFDDKGNGSWFCNQCTRKGDKPDGFNLLMKLHGWTFTQAKEEVAPLLGTIQQTAAKPERTEADKRDYMRQVVRGARPVTPGDPVWLYLERRCGDPSGVLADLRYHPALKHSVDGGNHPAMLAFMGWDGKRFSGIHRTYLTPDGHKAAVDPVKMSYGDMGAVRLGPAAERMGIAEGIETAIAASLRFGVPVWSGICANGLAAWTPPEVCRSVMICADNDENGTGYDAALDLGKRLHRLGIPWEVQIPDVVGTDWADAQMEGVA